MPAATTAPLSTDERPQENLFIIKTDSNAEEITNTTTEPTTKPGQGSTLFPTAGRRFPQGEGIELKDTIAAANENVEKNSISREPARLSDADQGALDQFRKAFTKQNSTLEYKKRLIDHLAKSHPRLLEQITATTTPPKIQEVTIQQNG